MNVKMSKSVAAKKPYNNIVRVGMWITVAAALVWVGGKTYDQIQSGVPWVLALGIAVLLLGLLVQFRKARLTK